MSREEVDDLAAINNTHLNDVKTIADLYASGNTAEADALTFQLDSPLRPESFPSIDFSNMPEALTSKTPLASAGLATYQRFLSLSSGSFASHTPTPVTPASAGLAQGASSAGSGQAEEKPRNQDPSRRLGQGGFSPGYS